MYSIRKWFYRPKKEDSSKLAQFYWADEELNMIAAELDSFDGRKDPERCSTLVNQLRQCQDKVLTICSEIMDDAIPDARANRDFQAKFPDDVMQENLSGQLWFGAECLAAGSNILNRETESAHMRPLAKALTRALDNVRFLLREHCLRNPNDYTDKVKEALWIFDRLFADFELCYVSAMVPVKTASEFHLQQEVIVLFSETLHRALGLGLVTQDMVDYCDPSLMFTIPRLAIVCGLLIFPEGPLQVDKSPDDMSELFRPFFSLLYKIRDLLWTLSLEELLILEKTLCSLEDPELVLAQLRTSSNTVVHSTSSKLGSGLLAFNGLPPFPLSSNHNLFWLNNSKQFIADFYSFNFGPPQEYCDETETSPIKSKSEHQPESGELSKEVLSSVINRIGNLQFSTRKENRVIGISGTTSQSLPADSLVNLNRRTSSNVSCKNTVRRRKNHRSNSLVSEAGTGSVPLRVSQLRQSIEGDLDNNCDLPCTSKTTSVGSSFSSCSSINSLEWEPESQQSCETSSYRSECQDDQEIALALQAAEIASCHKARARFKDSTDLIHRLFVCISGVADQLQTNFASDLRNILKCVFEVNSSRTSLEDERNINQKQISITNENLDSFRRSFQEQLADQDYSAVGRRLSDPVELLQDNDDSQVDFAEEAESANRTVDEINTISDYIESQGVLNFEEAPDWLPDELAESCMACQTSFTILRRRHHCRNCGKIFCARCSANSVPLPRFGQMKPVRVCNTCFVCQVTQLLTQQHNS